MALEWLPDAVRDPHAAIHSLALVSGARPKGCLHTTEGPGWPDYDGWSIPPHVTVRPIPRVGVDPRQHIPFTLASFALENAPGGVETNRARVYQVELIGTCDHTQKGWFYYWPEADDAVLLDLYRKVVKPMSDGLGIPLAAPRWVAYPDSYGAGNGVRLQGTAWSAYSGWHGHEHAAENHHGDPGLFPWGRMLALAEGADMPLTPTEIDAIATRTRDLILAATYGTKADGSPHTLGNVIGETLTAVVALTHGSPVTLSDAQVQALAAAVGAAVTAHLPASGQVSAGAFADELARRLAAR